MEALEASTGTRVNSSTAQAVQLAARLPQLGVGQYSSQKLGTMGAQAVQLPSVCGAHLWCSRLLATLQGQQICQGRLEQHQLGQGRGVLTNDCQQGLRSTECMC